MLHQMKLKSEPFCKIKSGSKTIELRLNDEKRQQVQVGDFIEFTMLDDTAQKLTVRVTALHHFNSFAELYAALPKEKLGYAPDEMPDPDHMDAYYPRDEQEKYGVLGIELRLTDLQKFVDAQEHGYSFGETYETALSEMRQGQKISHWIWYVFPQIQGLGISGTTAYFSIKDLNVKDNNTAETKRNVIDAAVALKLAMNTYELRDKDDKRKSEGSGDGNEQS